MSRESSPAASPSLARRWAQLLFGLAGWGLAVALMVRAGLGLGPWDAFHAGIHNLTGVGIGTASVLAGGAIVLVSLLLGVRPGIGTLANMVLIGVAIDAFLAVLPQAPSTPAGVAYFAAGVLCCGWCTGVYIAAGFGKGPRDGLVLALAERSGWPVRRVRTATELVALVLGWAMGGALGVGTLLFAVTVGPSMQWGLRRWGVLPVERGARREEAPVRRAA
jgi:hypothetical protein